MDLSSQLLVALGSAALFLAIHLVARRSSTRGFVHDTKVARGVGGAILGLVGFVSLAVWWDRWPEAFLGAEAPDSPAALVVWFLLGHLLADLGWFYWGHRALGAPLRADLVLHHLLGLAAVVASLGLGAAQVALAIVLSSELLPVTTGFQGWARARGDRGLERRALQGGLAVILAWRIPFWLFELTLLARHAASNAPWGILQSAVLFGFGAVLILDVFWVFGYLRHLAALRLESETSGA